MSIRTHQYVTCICDGCKQWNINICSSWLVFYATICDRTLFYIPLSLGIVLYMIVRNDAPSRYCTVMLSRSRLSTALPYERVQTESPCNSMLRSTYALSNVRTQGIELIREPKNTEDPNGTYVCMCVLSAALTSDAAHSVTMLHGISHACHSHTMTWP